MFPCSFTGEVITPGLLRQYRKTEAAKTADAALNSPRAITDKGTMIKARNYLMVRILMANGCRAGALRTILHRNIGSWPVDPATGVRTLRVRELPKMLISF